MITALAAVAGRFIGSALAEPMGGAILLALISGITCIIYTIDNRDEQRTPKQQIFLTATHRYIYPPLKHILKIAFKAVDHKDEQ